MNMNTRLSVNVNKIATLRNSRGGNNPDLIQSTLNIERFGADGITVHPRPDERHIRYQDVRDLRPLLSTEFNIEGNPKESSFVNLVLENKPDQVTLVPDVRGQLTSNAGWDTIKEQSYLKEIVAQFKKEGIRVSIFLNPEVDLVKAAADCGTDRIELYTEAYAVDYLENPEKAIEDYISCAEVAASVGLGLNAGHDLDLNNLSYFAKNIPNLLEVSIGHALISDALTFGLQNTVQLYKRQLVKD
ncbi:MAG TPA: pyridoxine 5'-phosphate synthase [Chitinophagaceae bacterium]|nr:pyridoxine 5'-phosphate synthase [Chitinophagaceae bacterium]